MLDVETKNRINTARDILVGKVPDPKSQVEQITIALIYKFMDDMDMEAEELGGERSFFKGEFEKYAWRKIFDPRMGGYEILALYSEAITKMNINPNIPQLFRDIFKNAYLPYRDPETLKVFLKTINDFKYDHSERLGDAFEYLLSVLGSQGDAGQFRTPRHIIDFMVAIVDPKKDDVILDPACGTAGFLISSYKHILKHNSSNYDPQTDVRTFESKGQSLSELIINSKNYKGDKLTPDERSRIAGNIKGYDISPDMVRLSLVNMYLHGLHSPRIHEYDTLTSEDNWNEFADVILANPPFMTPKGGIRPHKRFSITSNRSEVLFVDYIADHLKPDGRAAVIVPEGIIFQSGKAYKALRKKLVESCLVGVISLPAGVFNPYSGVKTSILWLDKVLAKKTDKILFVKVENDGFDLGAQRRSIKENDLPYTYNLILDFKNQIIIGGDLSLGSDAKISIVDRIGVTSRDDISLSGDWYKTINAISTKYPLVPLSDVASIGSGNSAPQENSLFENGKYPFCRTSDVGKVHLTMCLTEIADKLNEDGIKGLKLFPSGTILFPKSGASTYLNHRVILGIDSYVSSHLATINAKDAIINHKFLFFMLCKVDAKRLTNDQNYPSLRLTQIGSIKLPLPPLSVQEEIVAEIDSYQKIIDGARQVVENYKPRIDIDPEWPVVELGEVCDLITGGTPKTSVDEYWKGGTIKWLVSGDIHREEIFECEGRITETGLNNSNARYLPVNSVLIALNGQGKTRGSVALLRVESTCNQSLVAINPRDHRMLLPEFLFLQLKSRYQEIRNITGDNQRSGLNMPIIRKIHIYMPDICTQSQLIKEFMEEKEIVGMNYKLINKLEQKIKDRIARVWGE